MHQLQSCSSAPEVYSFKVDVWALDAMLYNVLTAPTHVDLWRNVSCCCNEASQLFPES